MKQDWVTQTARDFAARYVFECELMSEGEPVLIGNDGQEPLHTDDYPFCGDRMCPCYGDNEAYREFIVVPIFEQLLTKDEADRLYRGENI